MSIGSPSVAAHKPQGRSRKTNRGGFLGTVDGRGIAARRARDIEKSYLAELSEPITTAQRATVSLAASLQVQLELTQAALARGEAIDGHELVRLSRALRAALTDLGLNNPKPTEPKHPTLQEYLAGKRLQESAEP